jgi:RpiR family carbohydrate utilization transcriptional regulator
MPSDDKVTRPRAGKTVLSSIRALLESLPAGDHKVATVILTEPDSVIYMTVSDLARRAGTAESTVVRCSRKLGYTGYHDLKIHLARETGIAGSEVSTVIPTDAEPYDVLRAVLAIETEVINDIISSVPQDVFESAVRVLVTARRILLLGFGSSMTVCLEAQERFASIGLEASAPTSANMKLLACSLRDRDDAVICVSHTGATRETIKYAQLARRRGATVVALTSFARTRLERNSDITLVAGGQERDFRFGALSGRTAHLVVMDALYMALALIRGDAATASLTKFHDAEASWRL